ncbi:MAG: hypothetical protein ACR2MT_07125 [Aurantibacter sp.]
MKRKDIFSVVKLVASVLVITWFADKVIYFSVTKVSLQVHTGQGVGKLNHYLTVKDDADLLVFGSSRANHHIDPGKISKNGFNMGMDGQFIGYHSTMIKMLPKKRKQIVLLHLDPDKLFDSLYKGWDVSTLMAKYHQNELIKQEIDKAGKASWLNHFFWSLDYTNKVLATLYNYISPKYDYKLYDGYDPLALNKAQKAMRNKVLKNTMGESCPDKWQKNEVFIRYLSDIKTFCQENGKELIVFTSPIYRDYCTIDNKKLRALLVDLKIPYLDHTNLFYDNSSLDLWKDNKHLSNLGAELFTEQLASELSEPPNILNE